MHTGTGTGTGKHLAQLHYGDQSGVTQHISLALAERGHRLTSLSAVGDLELREPLSRRPRMTLDVARHLAFSGLRFGRSILAHRWNTTFAFDAHTKSAGRLLRSLPEEPELVLQHGALFSPGDPPPFPYVLFLDHTRALSMEQPPIPEVGLPAPLDYGSHWRARETAVYRGARSIAVFSRQVAQSLQADYGVEGERIHVVGAGANIFPANVDKKDDGNTILFVGKDFRRKGGHVLLRAFELVQKLRPGARLLIAGAKPRMSAPSGVTFLGKVPMEQMERTFASATVFALPTLREPFGIAFLDAMACALPCVGTSVEAVPEIIDHEETGLIVPPADHIALAHALLALLEDPQRAEAMGLRGRAKVEKCARWSHVAARLDLALGAESWAKPLFSEGQDAESVPERLGGESSAG